MAEEYNFQYTPLTGPLPGKSFVEQTEKAINELAGIVNEGSAQVEVITNLANQANNNSAEALEKATEALETSGRVYITLPNLEDADDYFDSQLYYFADSHSANLPVEDTGFLEVKTNDTKTAAEQVFIADTTGLMYMRHGDITATEVGDETVYSVTWETWSSALASEDYVQTEVSTGVATRLPLTGGTMSGAIEGNPLILTADDGNDSADLVLNPSGSATWNGKEVERVNASGTTPHGYIRYESGVQICFGKTELSTNQTSYVTYDVPFVSTPSVGVSITRTVNVRVFGSSQETGFSVSCSDTVNDSTVKWVSVGWWK